MLAKSYLDKLQQLCQLALIQLDQNDKRRTVGLIDEIEFNAEAAKWLLIDEIRSEEGEY